MYSLCIFQQILLSILRYENGNEHDTFHHNKNISKNLNFQGQQRNHAAQVYCMTLVSILCKKEVTAYSNSVFSFGHNHKLDSSVYLVRSSVRHTDSQRR